MAKKALYPKAKRKYEKAALSHQDKAAAKKYKLLLPTLRRLIDAGDRVQASRVADIGNALEHDAEQKRLIAAYNKEEKGWPIDIVEGDYEPERFYEMSKGYENCPEGGERCFRCFDLRLRKTAELAQAGGYDYFATTLTISPLKNAAKINEIGQAISGEYAISWLPSDFKKKNGYKRSIELSAEYELYRQNYCGCAFSKAEREAQIANA